MTEEIYYLYKITNLVTRKVYIGVTNSPSNRFSQHKSDKNRLVGKAIQKHGSENFTFEIICTGNKEYIYDLEPRAIELYKSNARTGHGYNLCDGGIVNNQINKGKSISKRKDDKPVFVSGFWFPNPRTALAKLNWGTGIYNSRRRSGILGETYFERKQGPQEYVFVTGFWFPSKKVAISKSLLTLAKYEKMRLNGSLGDIIKPKRKSNSTVLSKPCYFKGFWFETVFQAAKIFKMRPETVRQRILRGTFEENDSKANFVAKRFSNKLSYNKEV